MYCFFNRSTLHPFKKALGFFVVFLAVGEGEGGHVAAFHLVGAAGEGVVGDGGAFGEVAGFLELAKFFPALEGAQDFS